MRPSMIDKKEIPVTLSGLPDSLLFCQILEPLLVKYYILPYSDSTLLPYQRYDSYLPPVWKINTLLTRLESFKQETETSMKSMVLTAQSDSPQAEIIDWELKLRYGLSEMPTQEDYKKILQRADAAIKNLTHLYRTYCLLHDKTLDKSDQTIPGAREKNALFTKNRNAGKFIRIAAMVILSLLTMIQFYFLAADERFVFINASSRELNEIKTVMETLHIPSLRELYQKIAIISQKDPSEGLEQIRQLIHYLSVPEAVDHELVLGRLSLEYMMTYESRFVNEWKSYSDFIGGSMQILDNLLDTETFGMPGLSDVIWGVAFTHKCIQYLYSNGLPFNNIHQRILRNMDKKIMHEKYDKLIRLLETNENDYHVFFEQKDIQSTRILIESISHLLDLKEVDNE